MAQPIPYVTGPAHIFVALPSGGAGYSQLANPNPQYFGTTEDGPDEEYMREWEDVMNDLRGRRIAFDKSYQGQHVLLGAVMTRWKHGLYLQMADLFSKGAQAVNPGDDARGTIGTLMLTEGYGLTVWVQYPYSAFAPYSSGNLPTGLRLHGVIFEGPDRTKPGTGHKKLHIIFHAIGKFNPATGGFPVYDFDTNGLPSVE